MATSVIIDDFLNSQRLSVSFKKSDKEAIDYYWDRDDVLLLQLKDNAVFGGRTKWSQLDPVHYRILIATNFTTIDKLPIDLQSDPSNENVLSLHMLLMAFIRCLEERCQGTIDNIKLTRIAKLDVSYDFTLSMLPDSKVTGDDNPIAEKKGPALSVIVDNTEQ